MSFLWFNFAARQNNYKINPTQELIAIGKLVKRNKQYIFEIVNILKTVLSV